MSLVRGLGRLEASGSDSEAARGYLDAYARNPDLSIYLDGLLRCLSKLERRGERLSDDDSISVKNILGFVPRFGSADKPRLAFVDHSFHTKTLSSMFFVEYLRQEYEVDFYWSFGWRGAKDRHLADVVKQYSMVIFWQVFPNSMLEIPESTSVIIVPMLDGISAMSDWELQAYKRFAFIAFSAALAERLTRCNLKTVQAWAPPPDGSPPVRTGSGPPRVHFWQRTGSLQWDQVKGLLPPDLIAGVWLSTSADPFERPNLPAASDMTAFKIRLTRWARGRSEHRAALADCDLYIAPRIIEGIGMSVLEAMAMGCVPIVYDQPALNEYVSDKVGYRYLLPCVATLNLDLIAEKRRNIPTHLAALRNRWEASERKIAALMDGSLCTR